LAASTLWSLTAARPSPSIAAALPPQPYIEVLPVSPLRWLFTVISTHALLVARLNTTCSYAPHAVPLGRTIWGGRVSLSGLWPKLNWEAPIWDRDLVYSTLVPENGTLIRPASTSSLLDCNARLFRGINLQVELRLTHGGGWIWS
jgi:hypothetical protein